MASRGSQSAAARYARQSGKKRGKGRREPKPPLTQSEASTAPPPSTRSGPARPQPPAAVPRPRATIRQSPTDYRYVVADLIRIGVLTVIMFALMGVLALALR